MSRECDVLIVLQISCLCVGRFAVSINRCTMVAINEANVQCPRRAFLAILAGNTPVTRAEQILEYKGE
jgi:hypothetical protein